MASANAAAVANAAAAANYQAAQAVAMQNAYEQNLLHTFMGDTVPTLEDITNFLDKRLLAMSLARNAANAAAVRNALADQSSPEQETPGWIEETSESLLPDSPADAAAECASTFGDWFAIAQSRQMVDDLIERFGLDEETAQQMADVRRNAIICSDESYRLWEECGGLPGEEPPPGWDWVARYCQW